MDEELRAAVEDCSIGLEGAVLTLQQKAQTAYFQVIAGVLGDDGMAEALAAPNPVSADSAPVTGAPEDLAAMQERLAKEFADKPAERTAPRVTPYYTREE